MNRRNILVGAACLWALAWAGLSAPAPLSPNSIYHLEGSWKDQQGKPFQLRQLRGQIRVMAMIYATCRGACPTIIHDMQVIESKLSAQARPRVSFVLVSIDPSVDTPARLAGLAKQRKLTEGKWRLLQGNDTLVQDLAALLGFKFRKISDTDFAHSNMITVLDSEGQIIHQQVGLNVDPADTLAAIDKLIASDSVPPCCK
jgi:protein SCO1/2